MDIKQITFKVKTVLIREVTIDSDGGFDMPENGKELVAMVNEIHNNPSIYIVYSNADEIEKETEVFEYEVIEGES